VFYCGYYFSMCLPFSADSLLLQTLFTVVQLRIGAAAEAIMRLIPLSPLLLSIYVHLPSLQTLQPSTLYLSSTLILQLYARYFSNSSKLRME